MIGSEKDREDCQVDAHDIKILHSVLKQYMATEINSQRQEELEHHPDELKVAKTSRQQTADQMEWKTIFVHYNPEKDGDLDRQMKISAIELGKHGSQKYVKAEIKLKDYVVDKVSEFMSNQMFVAATPEDESTEQLIPKDPNQVQKVLILTVASTDILNEEFFSELLNWVKSGMPGDNNIDFCLNFHNKDQYVLYPLARLTVENPKYKPFLEDEHQSNLEAIDNFADVKLLSKKGHLQEIQQRIKKQRSQQKRLMIGRTFVRIICIIIAYFTLYEARHSTPILDI